MAKLPVGVVAAAVVGRDLGCEGVNPALLTHDRLEWELGNGTGRSPHGNAFA